MQIHERKEVSLDGGPCANDTYPTHIPLSLEARVRKAVSEQIDHVGLCLILGGAGASMALFGFWAVGRINSDTIGICGNAFLWVTGLYFVFCNPKA